MKAKTEQILKYALDRFGEQSTWQGIGFVVGLIGGRELGALDWGQAAGLGGAISAIIKMLLPDQKGNPQ